MKRTVDGVAAAALWAAPVLANADLVVERAEEKGQPRLQTELRKAGLLVRVDGEASTSEDALMIQREDLYRVFGGSHVRDLRRAASTLEPPFVARTAKSHLKRCHMEGVFAAHLGKQLHPLETGSLMSIGSAGAMRPLVANRPAQSQKERFRLLCGAIISLPS